ncbi:flagellar export chaperone FliS [Aquabacterium sp. J223]|uniref:flagellar export chaperone FliS n=1 Tax=Aquabacterium sp. J223 TaxID=2898431 RepID=UPI0021ADD06C|nr:flagellar export chaperone FliS [Aquabacterium sp. J223]UUX94870.1 flagellar export chaperone FliS [Aquabacterium sp. J223]
MFTSSSRSAGSNDFSALYRRTGVETQVLAATPHHLVALLFDGLLESVARARGAIEQRDLITKGEAIGRAVRIVEEGLKAALDMQAGGKLAGDLRDLYDYLTLRLTQANLRNDPAPLDECRALVLPLQQAWAEIRPAA